MTTEQAQAQQEEMEAQAQTQGDEGEEDTSGENQDEQGQEHEQGHDHDHEGEEANGDTSVGEGNGNGNSSNADVATHLLEERLERWQDTLARIKTDHDSGFDTTDEDKAKNNRVMKMWEGKVAKLADEVTERRAAEAAAPTEATGTGKDTGATTEAASGAKSGQPRERKAKTGGAVNCLCGCGHINKPGSRFKPGHDAVVKGMLGRVKKETAQEGFRFPVVLVQEAVNNANLAVADYDRNTILGLAAKIGQDIPAATPAPAAAAA